MAKVLLVEDDNNLREIFSMRLEAEGYSTMSAADGEEALVVAMKQKPDLIIADVMMPKLSGFEMLETLRSTPEMANVKVIMMTALGQAEDRTRGEKLGVVKYLVKSQVTLEDFVRVVKEVLQPGSQPAGSSNSPSDGPAQPTINNIGGKSMDDQTNNQGGAPGGDQPQPGMGGDMGGGSQPSAPADGGSSMPQGDNDQPAEGPNQPPAAPAPDENPAPGAPTAPPAA